MQNKVVSVGTWTKINIKKDHYGRKIYRRYYEGTM